MYYNILKINKIPAFKGSQTGYSHPHTHIHKDIEM